MESVTEGSKEGTEALGIASAIRVDAEQVRRHVDEVVRGTVEQTLNALTVQFHPFAGTAVNGTGYASISTSVTIPANQEYADVVLTPTDDDLIEGNESAVLVLRASADYRLNLSMLFATANITDNDLPWIDLDIDSDNDADEFALPARSEAEDDVEEESGHGGKVIRVNNWDEDRDGIPDFADGYNLNPALSSDGSSNKHFTPIVLERPDVGLLYGTVQFEYSASDPAVVQYSLEQLVTLPENGHLRLWKKNGTEQRYLRSISSGGDFIPTGLAVPITRIFGESDTVTLYVEAVRPGTDLTITAKLEAYLSSGITTLTDTVRLTAVDMRLESRPVDGSEGDWRPVQATLTSDRSQSTLQGDELQGFAVYRLKVTDPRQERPSTVNFGGQTLNLVGSGSTRYTNTFATYQSMPGEWMGYSGGYLQLSGSDNEFSYNPKKPNVRAVVQGLVSRHTVLVGAMDQSISKMRTNGAWRAKYPNDTHASAMGKEFHAEISEALKNQPGWMTDVYVRVSTGKIEHIGATNVPSGLKKISTSSRLM